MESDPGDLFGFDESQKYVVDEKKIEEITSTIQKLLSLDNFEVSVSFVSTEEIAELNSNYRNLNKPTDVLSFPQIDWPSPLLASTPTSPQRITEILSSMDINQESSDNDGMLLGDVIICLDVAAQNAEQIGQSLAREVCFLIIHGILHLCGHDHEIEAEEKIMLVEQDFILARLTEIGEPWQDAVIRTRLN